MVAGAAAANGEMMLSHNIHIRIHIHTIHANGDTQSTQTVR